jgi:hypothetical protein
MIASYIFLKASIGVRQTNARCVQMLQKTSFAKRAEKVPLIHHAADLDLQAA